MRKNLLLTVLICSVFLLGAYSLPQVYSVTGLWRLLNPTEFAAPAGSPAAAIRGIYALNGGTGSIGAGNVWAVGDGGYIFKWDGFSWTAFGPSPSQCELNSVNFGGPLIPSGSSFSGITQNSGWAVGGHGPGGGFVDPPCTAPPGATALFYDGTGWSTQTNGLTMAGAGYLASVYTVTGSSSVEAFAVGSNNGVNGAFWHWFGAVPGGAWGELLPNPAAALGPVNGVYMTHCCFMGSADEGWAVGNGGKVYRYPGANWGLFQTVDPSSCGTPPDLFGVAMSSRTDGWAVGACGSIYHFTGGTWQGPVSSGTTSNDLLSITMLSDNEAWAVGKADLTGPTILHGTSLTGTPSWNRVNVNKLPSAGDLFSVTFGVSGGSIWSSGAGGLLALCSSGCSDSSTWGTTTSPLANPPAGPVTQLTSVFMTGDNDGWAVGTVATGKPSVFHWDGATLTRGTVIGPIKDLFGVSMSGSSEGWAVGGDLLGEVTLHYTSGTWTNVPVFAACGCILRGIQMIGSNEGWAVGPIAGGGGGKILHLPNSAGPWQVQTTVAPATDLYSVYFDPSDSNSGWAVGGNGGGGDPPRIFHTTNRGFDGWIGPISNPGGAPNGVILKSIFMKDNTHIWVVGTGSTILFSGNMGGTWSLQLIGGVVNPPLDIRGVFFDSNNDGWAVGTDFANLPVLLHYNGAWQQVPISPAMPPAFTSALNGLYLTSSTNGLAVGTEVAANPTTLALVFHLDPPGLYVSTTATSTPTTATSVVTTTSVVTMTSSSTSTPTSFVTSQTSTSTSTVETSSSSISSSTETSASSQTSSSTSSSSSEGTTVTVIQSSSMTTPLVMPAVPGFPLESIIAGIMVGMAALVVLRRRRR